MKRYIFSGLGCLLLGVVALWWQYSHHLVLPSYVQVGERVFTLEVAQNDATRAEGLGGRDTMCLECAMLFLFARPGSYVFWMKGMRFPLDIAWLRDDTIVHIERHIPSESTDTYRSPVPANRVIEWNAGTLDQVQVGDRVHFTP